MPIELELLSNRPPEFLTLRDQYLAGDIGTMEYMASIESVKKQWESKLAKLDV